MTKSILINVAAALTLTLGCSGAPATTCGAGTVEQSGTCVAVTVDAGAGLTCGAGTIKVNGACVAVQDGGAQTVCGAGTVMINGACVAVQDGGSTVSCGAGTVLVNGACVATANDGGSTVTCGAGTVLVNGACVVAATDGGSTVTCGAGTVLVNGACVATATDDGGSTVTCGAGTVLVNGACVVAATDGGSTVTCGTGTVLVNGACVAAATDDGGSTVSCGAGTVLVNGQCVASVVPQDGGSGIVCGAGTLLVNGQCVAQQDGGQVTVCGKGTVLSNSTCVIAPAPVITSARLTLLHVKYDLTKAAHLNIPIPITFGITAQGPADAGAPPVTKVNVMFSFIVAPNADGGQPAPDADGGAAITTCNAANGIDVNVLGDGVEHTFDGEVVPDDSCAGLLAAGTQVTINLGVAFDEGAPNSNIDYPAVSFTDALATQPLNALCRANLGPAGTGNPTGCVSNITLEPVVTDSNGNKLVEMNIEYLTPETVVANVWPIQQDPYTPDGGTESPDPSLVVDFQVSLLGRDPTKFKHDYSGVTLADMSKLPQVITDAITALPAADQQAALDKYLAVLSGGMTPAEEDALDDLPGTASVQYFIAPSTGPDFNNWQQIPIDDPKNPDPTGHVMEIDLTEINAGEPATFNHALYLENTPGAAFQLQDELTTGTWKTYSEFKIKGCLVIGFAEGGDDGDEDDDADAPDPGESGPTNCKEVRVMVLRVPPDTAADNSLTWQDGWDHSVGGDVAKLHGVLSTQNILDLGGARTNNDALVTLSGTIGAPYSIELVHISGKAGALTAAANSYYNASISAFGISLASDGATGSSLMYNTSKTFAKQWNFPTLSWPVGPVSVQITGSVGGNIGFTSNLAVTTSADASNFPSVPAATASGQFVATFTPTMELTGSVTGNVSVLVASASLTAALQIVKLSAPLVATLQWGVTGGGVSGAPVTQLTVGANAKLDVMETWLNFEILATGTLGICFFCGEATFSIAKFTNPDETTNVMTRTAPNLVLQ